MYRDYVNLSINGNLYRVKGEYAFRPLSDFLRYELAQTGTKVVCAEGDCGACTIMFRRAINTNGKFASINSCISAAILLDGSHIISVEGLGSIDNLSEVQDSMVRNFGGQCGFCTPGFVMSITNMYEQKVNPDEKNAKNYLTGNLCRCTGYLPIIKAAMDVDTRKIKPIKDLFDFQKISEPLLEDLSKPIKICSQNKEFFAPTSLAMASEYLNENPDARIFSGATDLGVQINKGRPIGAKFMSLHLLTDLNKTELTSDWISVGARVTLSDLQIFLEDKAPEFSNFLNIFASPQIKNAATLIGNVANGSPIADTTPYLLTADAEVLLFGPKGERILPLKDFVLGYKSFDLQKGEFITHIRFKHLPSEKHVIGLYKISQRRDLDISCVNASFAFEIKENKVDTAKIAFGGVGPKTLRLFEVEKSLVGQEIDFKFIKETQKLIEKSLKPISDARGSADFRQIICQDLFEAYLHEHGLV